MSHDWRLKDNLIRLTCIIGVFVNCITLLQIILTMPKYQYGVMNDISVGMTQNTPTHRSATARLARKKLVIFLIFLWRNITKITRLFPVEKKSRMPLKCRVFTCSSYTIYIKESRDTGWQLELYTLKLLFQ